MKTPMVAGCACAGPRLQPMQFGPLPYPFSNYAVGATRAGSGSTTSASSSTAAASNAPTYGVPTANQVVGPALGYGLGLELGAAGGGSAGYGGYAYGSGGYPTFAFAPGFPWYGLAGAVFAQRYGVWVAPGSSWVWHPIYRAWRLRWWR